MDYLGFERSNFLIKIFLEEKEEKYIYISISIYKAFIFIYKRKHQSIINNIFTHINEQEN